LVNTVYVLLINWKWYSRYIWGRFRPEK